MKKVGFIDSGVGGLTVLNSCLKAAQSSQPAKTEILYFADLANMPYGGKSKGELKDILHQNLLWFRGKVELLILACNTSSGLLPELEPLDLGYSVLSLFEALELGLAGQDLGSCLVFSTEATAQGGFYEKLLGGKAKKIHCQACPGLVDLIEADLDLPPTELKAKASLFLTKLAINCPFEPDQIILGCTHYPLVAAAFAQAYPRSQIIDPANSVSVLLKEQISHQAPIHFYSSGAAEHFSAKLKSITQHLGHLETSASTAAIQAVFAEQASA